MRRLREENERLRTENDELQKENQHLLEEISDMQQCKYFSIDSVKDNPKLFRFYTGLPDYATFQAIFNSFGSAVETLVYHGARTNKDEINDDT